MPHGANFFDGNGHIDLARLLKLQREWKGLPFLQRLFDSNDHHVHVARLEDDLSSRRQFHVVYLAHARHAVVLCLLMKLNLIGHWR